MYKLTGAFLRSVYSPQTLGRHAVTQGHFNKKRLNYGSNLISRPSDVFSRHVTSSCFITWSKGSRRKFLTNTWERIFRLYSLYKRGSCSAALCFPFRNRIAVSPTPYLCTFITMNKKKTLIIEPIIREKTHKNIKIGVHVTLTHSGEAGINKKQHTEIANQSVIRK